MYMFKHDLVSGKGEYFSIHLFYRKVGFKKHEVFKLKLPLKFDFSESSIFAFYIVSISFQCPGGVSNIIIILL